MRVLFKKLVMGKVNLWWWLVADLIVMVMMMVEFVVMVIRCMWLGGLSCYS